MNVDGDCYCNLAKAFIVLVRLYRFSLIKDVGRWITYILSMVDLEVPYRF